VFIFIGVSLDSIGREGLGRTGGGERQSIKKGVDRGRVERVRAVVVDQSMD